MRDGRSTVVGVLVVGRRVGDGGKHTRGLCESASVLMRLLGLRLGLGVMRLAVADVGTLHELTDADARTTATITHVSVVASWLWLGREVVVTHRQRDRATRTRRFVDGLRALVVGI